MLPPPLETDEEKCCLIALVDKNVAMSKEQDKKAAYRAQSKACGVSGQKNLKTREYAWRTLYQLAQSVS